jgi:hypothetical protein
VLCSTKTIFVLILFACALIRSQITLSKHLVSDTGVAVTIALQPVIAIAAGSKLMVTVTGDLVALQAQLITTVSSPIAAVSFISAQQVSSRELMFTFNANIAANSILQFSVGNFRLPSASSPGSDAVEAAIVDPNGDVDAPSSSGSYPAIFNAPISGSSISISSSVANAPDVAVNVTVYVSVPKISMIKLSGLGFVALAGSSVGRRLLQDGISCSNLIYTGAPIVRYFASDGELIVTFHGSNGATVSNMALPCVCTISGFRNPAAAVASPGVRRKPKRAWRTEWGRLSSYFLRAWIYANRLRQFCELFPLSQGHLRRCPWLSAMRVVSIGNIQLV